MKENDITLQHFANGANTVVNFSGNNETDGNGNLHGYAGSMNANNYSAGTGTGDLSVEMKTFYDKVLLELAQPNLVHDQFGVKKPIPRNSGKTIEFRYFEDLPKATTPITEGVTPSGEKLKAGSIVATVEQYGDYVEQTDLLELTAIDNTIVQATKKLAQQAGVTLDTVVRDEIIGGTNKMLAKKDNGNGTFTSVSERKNLTKDCHITVKDVFRCATELKAVNAPKIGDSYVAIIHPYVAYSLMQEAGDTWLDIQKYARPDNILRGEIGKLGGVRFVESTEAKIYAPAAISDGKNRLTVQANAASAATTVYVNGLLTAASGVSIKCFIDGVANTITAITPDSANNKTALTVSALSAAVSAGAMVCGEGGGKDGSAVFCTLFLAEEAYGTTELEGGGLEHIVNQRGKMGNDQLHQRSSVGWKATKVAKILKEQYILRYESCSPDVSLTTDAN